jgi:ClpP class serine protease
MSTHLPHLAQHLFNVPLAIHPGKAEVVMAALADRFGIARLFSGGNTFIFNGQASALDPDTDPPPRRDVGYDVTRDGVAMISVCGTLVHRLGTMRPYSGMTGYDGIRHNLLSSVADPSVRAVMFDVNSPGGQVSGCFDLVDTIYAVRDIKPIWAVLNENAYSAAYAIASAAQRVTVPRTGGTGSIGAVCLHTDFSKALESSGITVTIIRSAARKMEENNMEPLSDMARAAIQADVDAAGELFVATVARNRGISAARVRDTQAACFQGALGVTAGLADEVMAPDAAYRALIATLN